eukprot:3408156-Alexandrium_andersonii.AAC.1
MGKAVLPPFPRCKLCGCPSRLRCAPPRPPRTQARITCGVVARVAKVAPRLQRARRRTRTWPRQ